jgi:tetratricopeptide (TPR) repeat protein
MLRTSLIVACSILIIGCGNSDLDDDDRADATPVAQPLVSQAAVDAPAEVEAGKQALREGKYDEAVESFTRAIANSQDTGLPDPQKIEADVYFQRGTAYLGMGFPDTAAQDFTTAINLTPQEGAYFEQRACAHQDLGDSYNALRDATQAIRLSPDNTAAYQIRGEVYLQRAQYERATADFEQAIEQDPTLAEATRAQLADAYARWGEQLSQAGNPPAAAEKLAKARELNPSIADGATAAGVAETAPVEQTVAKPVIDEADKSYNLGRGHQAERQYDQALIEFTEAIALRPDFHEAYLRRGETLLALGFPDTALEDLKRAVHRGAASAEAHRLQARAHMALKNPHRAMMAATDALHADPSDAHLYALRGEAYLQLESWDRAIADLEEAVRRAPALRDSLAPKLATARREQAAAREPELQASTESPEI